MGFEQYFVFLPYMIPILLIFIGLFGGRAIEKRHFDSLQAREAIFSDQPAITFLKNTYETDRIASGEMVMGSAVISIDHFKRFLAGLFLLVGGRVESYETLVDRARREAVLRMQEQAIGMDIIVNVRIETSTIGNDVRKGLVGSVEAMAYGTALKYK